MRVYYDDRQQQIALCSILFYGHPRPIPFRRPLNGPELPSMCAAIRLLSLTPMAFHFRSTVNAPLGPKLLRKRVPIPVASRLLPISPSFYLVLFFLKIMKILVESLMFRSTSWSQSFFNPLYLLSLLICRRRALSVRIPLWFLEIQPCESGTGFCFLASQSSRQS